MTIGLYLPNVGLMLAQSRKSNAATDDNTCSYQFTYIFGSNKASISFVNVASDNSCQVSGIYLHCTSLFSRGITYLLIFIRSW